MHNCKSTKSSLIDLTLDEIPPAKTKQLLAELNACPACREEYAALRSTLHLSTQALRSSLPDEEFWSGYRVRLDAKLLSSQVHDVETGFRSMTTQPAQTWGSSLFRSVMELLTRSVRVPVPVALGLLLLFGASVFFLRQPAPVNVALSTPPAPETRTVTVPVVQEKVVTRVVYVEKKSRRFRNSAPAGLSPSSLSDSVARARSDASLGSLADFKPTDQIRLTITKGSNRDEK